MARIRLDQLAGMAVHGQRGARAVDHEIFPEAHKPAQNRLVELASAANGSHGSCVRKTALQNHTAHEYIPAFCTCIFLIVSRVTRVG